MPTVGVLFDVRSLLLSSRIDKDTIPEVGFSTI